jgi:chaperonin GroEL
MTDKRVTFSKEARKGILKGIKIISDAVTSTMGPAGRNVLIENSHRPYPASTKDGVTVAKEINLKRRIKNVGVRLIKEAAEKTEKLAGDGTTTATLLASEMSTEGLSYLDENKNAVKIKREIDSAIVQVIDNLKNNYSEEITSEEQLKQIATISANNDESIGNLIHSAVQKVGADGIIQVEESKTGETYLETVEGMRFNKGFKSPYFVTDNSTMTSALNNPYVLLVAGKLTQVKELLPILESVSSNARSLLIIAEDVESEALATLIVNKMRDTLNVCAVQAPGGGSENQKELLEDIAIVTGATVFSKSKGMRWDRFSSDWLGSCRSATVTKDTTTIVDGAGEIEKVDKLISDLQNQIEIEKSEFNKQKLNDRIGSLAGGVSIIHVGAGTETEAKEKKDRVEDALNATKAAVAEGIVAGGGSALLYAREVLDTSKIGSKIVYNACGKPFEKILTNAGYSESECQIIAKYKLSNEDKDKWLGYDIFEDEVVNMKEKGIIDPLRVTRSALESAASIAGTILLTETVLTEDNSKPE